MTRGVKVHWSSRERGDGNAIENGDFDFRASTIPTIGSFAAIAAAAATLLYGIAQVLQVVKVLRSPVDGILIFSFSLAIVVPFIIAMLALHHTAPREKKFWSGAALIFTIMYGTYVTLNYVVQLATVTPAALHGTLDQIRILDQTPHSLFWDMDALGYICMGFATLFGSFVFKVRGIERWPKRFFIANAIMTPIIAVVYFYPIFSVPLLIIGSPWIVTAAGSMFCLSLYFGEMRRTLQSSK